MKIRKGDRVEVISGNHRGERGEVQSVIRKKDRHGRYDPNKIYVVIAGVNLIKKHQRRTGDVNTQFGIIEREGPVHISAVQLIAPGADQPTRVQWQVLEDGHKTRYSPKFDEVID